MDEQRKKELKKLALKVKKHVIVGTNRAKSGHRADRFHAPRYLHTCISRK